MSLTFRSTPTLFSRCWSERLPLLVGRSACCLLGSSTLSISDVALLTAQSTLRIPASPSQPHLSLLRLAIPR